MPKTSIDLPAKRYFQTLVFNIGIVIKVKKPLASDGIRVGRCNWNDEWLDCKGGYNHPGWGPTNPLVNDGCRAGHIPGASVEIKCDPGKHNTKF